MRLKAIFSYVGPDLESSILQLKGTQIEQVKYRIKLWALLILRRRELCEFNKYSPSRSKPTITQSDQQTGL